MDERAKLLDHGDDKKQEGEVLPYRVQINLTVAHMDPEVLDQMFDGLADDAEARGFFYEWGFMDRMDMDEVIEGSPLDRVVKGEREPDGHEWPEKPPTERE